MWYRNLPNIRMANAQGQCLADAQDAQDFTDANYSQEDWSDAEDYPQQGEEDYPRTGEDDWGDGIDEKSESRARDIAKQGGINILRDRELSQVTRDPEGNVTGGLWTATTPDVFTFDVAVDPSHRRQGIGLGLVQQAISEYQEMQEAYPDLKMEAQVTSPEMQALLEKMGWQPRTEGGHLLMSPPG